MLMVINFFNVDNLVLYFLKLKANVHHKIDIHDNNHLTFQNFLNVKVAEYANSNQTILKHSIYTQSQDTSQLSYTRTSLSLTLIYKNNFVLKNSLLDT